MSSMVDAEKSHNHALAEWLNEMTGGAANVHYSTADEGFGGYVGWMDDRDVLAFRAHNREQAAAGLAEELRRVAGLYLALAEQAEQAAE